MARRQAPLPLFLLALAAAGVGACGARDFRLGGTVTLASSLQSRLPKQNAVMFIIAKNLGGVPLAVKRVVNPQFPVSYTLSAEDLVVPGTNPKEPLRLEVEINTHGDVGSPHRGDLVGAYPEPVAPGDRRVYVVVDHQL